MKRRAFLIGGSAAGAAAVGVGAMRTMSRQGAKGGERLVPPAGEPIPVAFALSPGATMIDFAGPWEVFQDVVIEDSTFGRRPAFSLFTIAETTEVITASAGMKIVPDHSYQTAPSPKVVVIPAQSGSPALHAWLRKTIESTDVMMSVCTGAFQLGKAGLLAGKEATTHHEFYDRFEKSFPDVKLKRGLRFVEGPKISTAGGLTSGIDLALRVVERYFGRERAEKTAFYMEYQSKGWIL
jgi:transcriptional regulator GlxA family with amidase domain